MSEGQKIEGGLYVIRLANDELQLKKLELSGAEIIYEIAEG